MTTAWGGFGRRRVCSVISSSDKFRPSGSAWGAQLLAEAAGAKIHPADPPEIGWSEIEVLRSAMKTRCSVVSPAG